MPLIEGALINGAAAGLTLDVVISSLVFWAFMLSQKEKGPAPLRFIVLNLFVGPDVSTGRCPVITPASCAVACSRLEGFPVPDSIS